MSTHGPASCQRRPGGLLFRSRPRPTKPLINCGASTWAVTGGLGRASATPRPAARTLFLAGIAVAQLARDQDRSVDDEAAEPSLQIAAQTSGI